MKKNFWSFATPAALTLSLILSACGGSGGNGGSSGNGGDGGNSSPIPSQPASTISGTAAGGAPIAGTVTIKDSRGQTKTVDIGADGSYSVDVADMSGPFMIRATGTVGDVPVTYYSAATSADFDNKVNVTPLTTLLISNVALTLAESYYNDGRFASITEENLNIGVINLQKKLAPALETLGLNRSVDLLRESFKADHTGLDAALDLIKVQIDPATNVATLINAMTQSVIGSDNLNSAADDSDATPLLQAEKDALSAGPTELARIQQQLAAFASLFATSVPAEDDIVRSPLFHPLGFMHDGQDLQMFAHYATMDNAMVGLKLTSSDIVFSNTAAAVGKAATANIVIELKNGQKEKFQWRLVKNDAGNWIILGNGKVADVAVRGYATYYQPVQAMTQPTFSSGLQVYVQVSMKTAINKAVVTGNGIRPASGIVLTNSATPYYLSLDQDGGNIIPECVSQSSTNCIDIDAVADNTSYNVKLYSGINGIDLANGAGYDIKIAKRPLKAAQLTADMFMPVTELSIDGVAVTDLSQFVPSKNLFTSWANPSKLSAQDLSIVFGLANSGTGTVSEELLPNDTSNLKSLGGGADGAISANVWLTGRDAYDRSFSTNLRFGSSR